jgi:hypothetical protein
MAVNFNGKRFSLPDLYHNNPQLTRSQALDHWNELEAHVIALQNRYNGLLAQNAHLRKLIGDHKKVQWKDGAKRAIEQQMYDLIGPKGNGATQMELV